MSMTNEERAVKNLEHQLQQERERLREAEGVAKYFYDMWDVERCLKARKQVDKVTRKVQLLERCLAEAINDMEKDKLARAKAEARERNQREASKMQSSMMRQFE
jgi:hypothetical protein